MLRGTNKVTNAIASGVECALPYATFPATGWKEVTAERKKICVDAARNVMWKLEAAGLEIVRKK